FSLSIRSILSLSFFFFTRPPTTAISTLSLHDALPISSCVFITRSISSGGYWAAIRQRCRSITRPTRTSGQITCSRERTDHVICRSEEHTSELQSLRHLVCRLLLEKKKIKKKSKSY